MHHPKPNKTGSLALRITYVYSVFAACIEGSSSAAAINVCGGVGGCVCFHSHLHVSSRELLNAENHCKSHIETLNKFFL